MRGIRVPPIRSGRSGNTGRFSPNGSADGPLISVVFTTYTLDRLPDVEELLESLQRQSYPNLELIFVAERQPELAGRVKAFARQRGIQNLKVVFNDGEAGLSPARNLGVQHARGDIIAFIDDDAIPFPDWAHNISQSYADPAVIGLTGPGLPLWQDDSLRWLPEEFYWIVSCTAFTGWNEKRPVRSAWGMNMSFRREAFDHCRFSHSTGQTNGGFEAWKAGPFDDAEFSINLRLRTGRPVLFDPAVRVRHKVYTYRLTSRFIRGQSFWQGYTKAILRRAYAADEDVRSLSREYDLLRRIVRHFLPRTLAQLATSPAVAWRRLRLTSSVLFHVGVGYLAGSWPRLGRLITRFYE